MLAYLGIVVLVDLQHGIFEPSFILCKSFSNTDLNTGYEMVKANNMTQKREIVLFTELADDNEFIHYLSHYRAKAFAGGQREGAWQKYVPKGALFWFPCDEHGERDMTQPPVFIKVVPDKHHPREGAAKILKDELAAKDSPLYLLTKAPSETEMLPIKIMIYDKY